MSQTAGRRRALVFVLVIAACVAGIAGYAAHVMNRSSAPPTANATPALGTIAQVPADGRPFVLYRSTALGPYYGRLAAAHLDDLDHPLGAAPLSCDRVHYAGGTGLCLEALRGAVTTYQATLFDARFARRATVPLAGPPSRTRVSPDGRRAGFTVFINGHGYSNPGFTTRTSIIDTARGDYIVDDLETWPVLRDGAPFKATDFNFWGITFPRDAARFYATLSTGGHTLLVEGEFEARRMRVIADGVECPSVSPDGQRIAFKRRDATATSGPPLWHVAVLDLATGQAKVLAGESRSVDDQIEWQDDRTLLYGMPLDAQRSAAETDVWAIAADGTGAARRVLPFAFSPAVVRP